MLGHASNPMLAQAEQGIQAKVPQKFQAGLERAVHAGLSIMYSPRLTQARNDHIKNSKDPVKDAGEGAARLVLTLYNQSGKKMPVDIIIPAAMIFAFEYLDLVSQAGKAQITPDMLAAATQSVADNVLPLMGITKDKLAKLIAESQQRQQAQGAPAPAHGGIIAGAQGGM